MLPPFTVARYGMYAAVAIAAVSVWLGHRAGASLDYAVLRGVIVFVIFAALGFGAEAVLMASTHDQQQPHASLDTPRRRRDREAGESEPASE